jgi:hypothetical protein
MTIKTMQSQASDVRTRLIAVYTETASHNACEHKVSDITRQRYACVTLRHARRATGGPPGRAIRKSDRRSGKIPLHPRIKVPPAPMLAVWAVSVSLMFEAGPPTVTELPGSAA